VTNFDGPLAECALRMVRLLDTPEAIPVLYPAVMREICYWLLTGPQGGDVVTLTLANPHTQGVINAIHSLRKRFAEPVRITGLHPSTGSDGSVDHLVYPDARMDSRPQWEFAGFREGRNIQLAVSSK
jgi:hypothetical protein